MSHLRYGPGSRVWKGAGAEEAGALATIELSERARKLAQVKTDVVGFRSLTKDIYTVGIIEYDERLKALRLGMDTGQN